MSEEFSEIKISLNDRGQLVALTANGEQISPVYELQIIQRYGLNDLPKVIIKAVGTERVFEQFFKNNELKFQLKP